MPVSRRFFFVLVLSGTLLLPITLAAIPGTVVTDFFGEQDIAEAITVLHDGTIVTAGMATRLTGPNPNDMALACYHSDGTLDPDFGDGGLVTLDFGSVEALLDVAFTQQRNIVAAGYSEPDAAVLQLTPHGEPDPDFGDGGLVTTAFSGSINVYTTVLPQPDGSLIAVGYTGNSSKTGSYNLVAARYGPDGALDPEFGNGTSSDGTVEYDVCALLGGHCPTGDDWATAAAMTSDGKIVIGGYSGRFSGFATDSNMDYFVIRLQGNGLIDPGFGKNGVVLINVWRRDYGEDLVIDPVGRIVVAGESVYGNQTTFSLIRLLPNGWLDPAFGTGGKVINPIYPGLATWATSLARQPDGKLLIAGYTQGLAYHWILCRYTDHGKPDPSFGKGGCLLSALGKDPTTSARAWDLVFLPELQKILVTGSVYDAPGTPPGKANFDFALRRYDLNGKLDMTFGQN